MSENFKAVLLEDTDDERRNASGYKLNSVTWYTRGSALNTGLVKTDNCKHNA